MNQSINQSINQSTNQPINQSVSQSVSQSINQSNDQASKQSSNQPFILYTFKQEHWHISVTILVGALTAQFFQIIWQLALHVLDVVQLKSIRRNLQHSANLVSGKSG